MPTAYRRNRICNHRLASTGDTLPCTGCGRRLELPVFSCARHGRCTADHLPDPEAVSELGRVLGERKGVEKVGNGSGGSLKVATCATCPDFDHGPKRLTIPRPPEYAGPVRSHRAVCTVVVGDEAEALHAVSGPWQRDYASRVGADYVVLRWPGHPDWSMSSKFGIASLLGPYDRVAYLDADVMVPPGAANLFDLVPAGSFGAYDEATVGDANHDRRLDRFVEFRFDHGYQRLPGTIPGRRVDRGTGWPTDFYLNAGVLVLAKRHGVLVDAPAFPMIPGHCAEQDLTNSRVYDAHRAGSLRVEKLPKTCNWMWWTDPGFGGSPPGAILHWAGRGCKPSRAAQMAAVSSWWKGGGEGVGTSLKGWAS